MIKVESRIMVMEVRKDRIRVEGNWINAAKIQIHSRNKLCSSVG
jgi:hypothetical protein